MCCLKCADDVSMSAEVRKASSRADQQTFHGMLVPRAGIRGVFWDRVDIDGDQITLRPWLRRRRAVNRDSIDAVGFEPITLPLMWQTSVRFRATGEMWCRSCSHPGSSNGFAGHLRITVGRP